MELRKKYEKGKQKHGTAGFVDSRELLGDGRCVALYAYLDTL